jgi:hypothetical protein
MEGPWLEALTAALHYWTQLADDERISESFRQVCNASRQQLDALGDRFG